MKKFTKYAALLLSLLCLASCGGPELLAVYPAYQGQPVTSTHHEFTKKDFIVCASYDDGTDEFVTDFEFEVKGMEAGYYVIDVTYDGMGNPVFVPINVNVYPSDQNAPADEAHDHDHE